MNKTMHFLTIEDGKLFDYPNIRTDERVEVTTHEQLVDIVNNGDVGCSSSIDFPTEHTTDPAVLALVASLDRG
jgi:hypothetical protein